MHPGDTVEHITELDVPTRVLIIWAPGGEVERTFGGANLVPIPKVELEEFPAEGN